MGLHIVVPNVQPMQLLNSVCYTTVLVSHICLVNQPILACLVHATPRQQEQSCIGSRATMSTSGEQDKTGMLHLQHAMLLAASPMQQVALRT